VFNQPRYPEEDIVLVESIVRETLALKDHRVVKVAGNRWDMRIHLERRRRRRLPCSGCGGRARVRDRLPERAWRHVPLWGVPVTLFYRPTRVVCPQCGLRVEKIPWTLGKSPLTQPLIVLLATWAKLLPWQVVAGLFGVSWGTVTAAVKRAVEFGLAHRDDQAVLYIGVDEISRRRGHIYHTQVYDLAGRRLLWSAEGREKETLQQFFQAWGPERIARIRGICCDMWAPYIDVICEKVPHAELVFDKFHIIRHLLKAVNDVRKTEAEELKKTHPDLLNGTRYIWLKNPWNLTSRQQERLSFLERLNLKVNRAYLLKEMFLQLWDYQSRYWAKRFLDRWFWWATHSRLKPMRDFAWKLRNHEDGILSWFDVPIDNGATEAMNNNAKAISHRARGFRTEKTFVLAQLLCLGKIPLPETTHKFL
jgi:transposase